ncbi:retropepsin-like aspartic protease family protein [Aurantiacibacter sp. D1-12]|uniref:retropepsin-like aspartic protease family protein n=1 Tax=Aurantiacibacter sp. D1-12 TaxID=2993658 RepID=UPI00237CFB8A|nr:TIGR02281 family clan AA aspartic protease [Aurantiacibacter sp. D1-12]MDE1467196.1 TIGR02281 family clan AA aspartic protease [Aurantiacibacter sp. D1-12]
MRIPLACVLLAGGLVGLAWPVISNDPATGDTLAAGSDDKDGMDAAQLASLSSTSEPVSWAEDVALDREPDGHFYADVSVDGVSSRMLVDTGASVIALTGEDAMAIGLFWDDSEVGPVAQGANGTVYGVHTRLRNVRLGNFEASDVEAMIIPEGLGISLLGQSFLSTINSVEIADNQMVLANQQQ